jgi:hypothetical protein
VIFGWKPGQPSKFRPILAAQETLTNFHWDDAKKKNLKKNYFFFFFKMADSKN